MCGPSENRPVVLAEGVTQRTDEIDVRIDTWFGAEPLAPVFNPAIFVDDMVRKLEGGDLVRMPTAREGDSHGACFKVDAVQRKLPRRPCIQIARAVEVVLATARPRWLADVPLTVLARHPVNAWFFAVEFQILQRNLLCLQYSLVDELGLSVKVPEVENRRPAEIRLSPMECL